MATKQMVIKAFEANPKASSAEIAKLIGCDAGYVRKTLQRNNLKLATPHGVDYRRLEERERCAALAERMGSPEIADAIRGGK